MSSLPLERSTYQGLLKNTQARTDTRSLRKSIKPRISTCRGTWATLVTLPENGRRSPTRLSETTGRMKEVRRGPKGRLSTDAGAVANHDHAVIGLYQSVALSSGRTRVMASQSRRMSETIHHLGHTPECEESVVCWWLDKDRNRQISP